MPSLDHVAVEVADLERAIGFYRDVLGLRLLFQERDEAHGEAFAFLELEGGNLELLARLDGGYAPREPGPMLCPHLALGTDDLDASLAALADLGVALRKGPLEIPGMVRWAYFCDPDGNVLEYVQWLGARPGSAARGGESER